jgi:hypothetical protein
MEGVNGKSMQKYSDRQIVATFFEKTPIFKEDGSILKYECQNPRKFMAKIINIIKNSEGTITMQDIKEYDIKELKFMADCIWEALPESAKNNSN